MCSVNVSAYFLSSLPSLMSLRTAIVNPLVYIVLSVLVFVLRASPYYGSTATRRRVLLAIVVPTLDVGGVERTLDG